MKKKKKGFSLIEILLVIVITLLMLGGIFMLYNKIESDSKASKQVETVRRISSSLYDLKNQTTKLSSLTSDNINSYLKLNLPEEITDDYKIRHINNATTLFQAAQGVYIYAIVVPAEDSRVCSKVFQQLYNSMNGLTMTFVENPSVDDIGRPVHMTQSQISENCANKNNSYYIIFNLPDF